MTSRPLTYGRFVSVLRTAARDWFEQMDCAVSERRRYCLASRDDWRCNIIDSAALQFVEGEIERNRGARTPFPLHQYVQHGLSSQALLFNRLGPLAGRNDLRPLEAALEEAGVPWPASADIEFEYEDRAVFSERQAQPTSIDCVIGDPSSPGAIFIESKLVETGLGGCSVFAQGGCDGVNPSPDFDLCYLNRIKRTYFDRMREYGLLDTRLGTDTSCPLVNHYQFYRELLLALQKDGYFVLLGDSRSPVFVTEDETGPRGLWRLLVSWRPEVAQRRVAFVPIQDVLRHAETEGDHGWTRTFRDKYAL